MSINPTGHTSIGRQNEKILAELSLLREEMKANRQHNRGSRQTITNISDHFGREELRLGEIKEDVETMIKLELGGAMANLETRIVTKLQVQTEELHQIIQQAVTDIKAATKNTEVPT